MLTDKLYPTSETVWGYGITADIRNISHGEFSDDCMRPYTMGYVKGDEVPAFYKLSSVESIFESGTNKLVIYNLTKLENNAWGFWGNKQSSSFNTSDFVLYRENDAWLSKNQGNQNSVLSCINSGYLSGYTVNNLIGVTFYISYETDENVKPNGWQANGGITKISDFLAFCAGELDLTFTLNNETYTVNIADFNEQNVAVIRNNDDTGTFTIGLVNVSLNFTGSGGTNTSPYLLIQAYIKCQTENDIYYISGVNQFGYDFRILDHFGNSAMTMQHYPFTNGILGGYFLNGMVGEIDYATVAQWAHDYSTEMKHYVPELNCFRSYTGSSSTGYQWQLKTVLKPDHVATVLRLRLKQYLPTYSGSRPPVTTTYTTDINVNKYDENDVPTGDILNGSYASIISELRPWQMVGMDITANEFDPDDIPEYSPEPEPGSQDENTGSSITRPGTLGVGGTNGFITQYSLTAAQIGEIGRLLWLSFTDADYYKNFLFTLTTTGTLNLSNLLDYFVSLRVYPFPLINVPSHAAAGQDMWIGAGLVPLAFTSQLHTINNYADYVDAGSCVIPRYYNDFRDYTHTQIMLYLPYCGTVQLNPADVVGGTLHASYAVDFATGGCTAYVDLTTWDGYTFPIAVLSGSIGADIPLTASNAAQIAARIAGDALNFAGTVGETVAGDIGRSAQAIGSAVSGDVVGAAIGVGNVYAGRVGGVADIAQQGQKTLAGEGVKMPMLAGGRGFGAFGAPQTAYVQIRRGFYAEGVTAPQGFREAYGEPYDQPVQVSSCTGFTVFANVDTSGLDCDAAERDAVKKMMQAGIYI